MAKIDVATHFEGDKKCRGKEVAGVAKITIIFMHDHQSSMCNSYTS